jgi:hypothetical protein
MVYRNQPQTHTTLHQICRYRCQCAGDAQAPTSITLRLAEIATSTPAGPIAGVLLRFSPCANRFLRTKQDAQTEEGSPESDPSSTYSSSTFKRAIAGPPHQGPISRPHPTREPLLIGVPRARAHRTDVMDKPSLQATEGQTASAESNRTNCRTRRVVLAFHRLHSPSAPSANASKDRDAASVGGQALLPQRL